MHTPPPTGAEIMGIVNKLSKLIELWNPLSSLLGFALSYDLLSSLFMFFIKEYRVWMQQGRPGLVGARGPPAVADHCTDSPAGDSGGGGFHTSLE